MPTRVVVLGAGFGGLELTSILSETLGDALDLVLIDQAESFVFGFSKFDVMFGRHVPAHARHPYRNIAKPGVRFVQAAVTAIDPGRKHVETSAGGFDADILVVALGADIVPELTPGLVEGGNEFYTPAGADRLREVLEQFAGGPAIVGVCGNPFKCPPAPSEAALLLHDFLVARGIKPEISLVMPFSKPIPPSHETSEALLAAFAERGITYVKDRLVTSLDPRRGTTQLDDGSELPCALFLGVPVHRVPMVVAQAGLTDKGWVPVDRHLRTKFPEVYAVGDVNAVGTPKAGVFAEGAARVAAASILAQLRQEGAPDPYGGAGVCYVEFGGNRVGRVNVDFFGGPKPTGTFSAPTDELVHEKGHFGSSRARRWFGTEWSAKAGQR